jgi:hypothetical protein
MKYKLTLLIPTLLSVALFAVLLTAVENKNQQFIAVSIVLLLSTAVVTGALAITIMRPESTPARISFATSGVLYYVVSLLISLFALFVGLSLQWLLVLQLVALIMLAVVGVGQHYATSNITKLDDDFNARNQKTMEGFKR